MAKSARAAEPKHKDHPELDEARRARHERLTLIIMLEGAVAIIAGMFLISQFLSSGEPKPQTLLIAEILFGVLVVGTAATMLLRRRFDRQKA
ncbi:MAG TPA: hypothetical protein VI796_04395 [Candidatus Thermoplasmatota archaeon]|nr:hypothetical protein [Candidatus Thermoplasmatota archaeon]